MAFDQAKFRALVLYIVWKTGTREGFGATKLHKVLWFSEARTFEAYGHAITGETFVRDKFGPRSKHLLSVSDDLVHEGRVERFTEHFYEFEVTRYRAFEPPDMSQFGAGELSFVDWWIDFVDRHTAASISRLSHDYGWEIAAMGEELPLYAYLATRVRAPRTDEEIGWAQEGARRLALK